MVNVCPCGALSHRPSNEVRYVCLNGYMYYPSEEKELSKHLQECLMAKLTDNEWAERWLNQQVYFEVDPERIYLVTAVNVRERTVFVGDRYVKPSEITLVKK